jgi:hypothetical protein
MKAQVLAVRAAYNALSNTAKIYISVTMELKLSDAEAAIANYEAIAGGAPSQGGNTGGSGSDMQQAMAAAAQVDLVLNALPTVTAENYLQVKGQVQAARNTYNGAGAVVQSYVKIEGYQKLIAAERAIATFEAAVPPAQDSDTVKAQNDAASVSSIIMGLDEITKDNYTRMKAYVVSARTAYNNLSTLAKSYVTPQALNKLTTAESKIAEFEAGESSGDNGGNGSIVLPGDDLTGRS